MLRAARNISSEHSDPNAVSCVPIVPSDSKPEIERIFDIPARVGRLSVQNRATGVIQNQLIRK